MELDALQEAWKSMDRKLDACIRLDRRLLQESVERRLGSYKRREVALRLPGLALGAVAAAWLGAFVSDHAGELRLALPALLLLAFVVVTGAATVRHLILVGRIDLAGPVVASQRRLQERKAERSRASLAVFLLAPLLWTPLLVVVLAALGVDAYRALPAPWLVANVALGVAAIPVGLFLVRLLARRLPGRPFLQRLADDLAGRNLSAATAWLGSLDRFERGDDVG
jgi:hypothetical protein